MIRIGNQRGTETSNGRVVRRCNLSTCHAHDLGRRIRGGGGCLVGRR